MLFECEQPFVGKRCVTIAARETSCRFTSPKNNVCEPEPQNEFREEILSQSPFI